ncbi:MAG: mercuric reductase [Syntrophobacter sp.]
MIFQFEQIDEYDNVLIKNTHPYDWKNPVSDGRYNLVVIGGGTAGLISAAGAAMVGAKVALIENSILGGDCLNFGCVPSKSIIRSARAAREARRAGDFGVSIRGEIEPDFPAIMKRMRELRSRISFHDSAERYKKMGVDVFLGTARFCSRDTLLVGETEIRFNKAVIATGARAAIPDIPGLVDAGYLTNETVFSLTSLPRRLAVIGGGPLGCELAQAFQQLGADVRILHRGRRLLGQADEEASEILRRTFAREGIQILLNTVPREISKAGQGKTIHYEMDGVRESMEVDEILVGAGRAPNVQGLGLEFAGVEYDLRKGIKINDYLATTNPNIHAAGDVCLPFKFTHMADMTARMALRNALFAGRAKISDLVIPWVTYTDPEIAHVGMSSEEAQQKGIPVETFSRSLTEIDRALLDGETDGVVKIHVRRGTDRIAGATIVAAHAGEMISEISTAITHGIGLRQLSSVIHPYPTQAEAIKSVVDSFNRGRLTPFVRKALSLWLRISRTETATMMGKSIQRSKMSLLNALRGLHRRR